MCWIKCCLISHGIRVESGIHVVKVKLILPVIIVKSLTKTIHAAISVRLFYATYK